MTKAEKRRKAIAQRLLTAEGPVAGGQLSEEFSVSRQIIVQDIAMLKAAGFDILATHRGYLIQKAPYAERVFQLHHDKKQTEDELSSIVALGGTVVDVFVRHKLYGQISVKLNMFTQEHVEDFVTRLRDGKSTELMNITGGYHYHTVRADSEEILDKIEEMLKQKKYLVEGV